MGDHVSEIVDLLRKPEAYPIFITGAGISLASGIPTFRGTDPNAVWANDVLEMGTNRFFARDPVKSWQWYLKRFEACFGAKPNAGHRALVEMEARFKRSLVITQNIDGLHAEAGQKNLIEVHGAARKVRCSRRGCVNGAPKGSLDFDPALFEAFQANPHIDTVPRCPVCRKLIRAHVLWFDEGYGDHVDYQIDRAMNAFDHETTAVIFVGTSFAVTVTDIAMQLAWQLDLPVYSVDPYAVGEGVTPIRQPAEVFLPWLAGRLKGEASDER